MDKKEKEIFIKIMYNIWEQSRSEITFKKEIKIASAVEFIIEFMGMEKEFDKFIELDI